MAKDESVLVLHVDTSKTSDESCESLKEKSAILKEYENLVYYYRPVTDREHHLLRCFATELVKIRNERDLAMKDLGDLKHDLLKHSKQDWFMFGRDNVDELNRYIDEFHKILLKWGIY